VTRHDQLAYGGWHQADPVLVNLDFSGDADTHDYDPPKGGAVARAVLPDSGTAAQQRFAKALNIARVFGRILRSSHQSDGLC
jgi:hypothetical protein